MTDLQNASMKKMAITTLQEDSFLAAAKADEDVLQDAVQLFVERDWLDIYAESNLFIHDETNFYPGNEQKLIDLLVAALED